MTVKIPLRLHGVDLRDPAAYDRIDPELSDLFWMSNGAVSLAVVLDEEGLTQATAAAADGARRIAKLMPGVFVAEVHDELVRLWASGKRRMSLRPFPTPRQVVGSGPSGRAMALYAWREVASWVREVLGTDPDEGIEYLDDRAMADLNAELVAIREELSPNHLPPAVAISQDRRRRAAAGAPRYRRVTDEPSPRRRRKSSTRFSTVPGALTGLPVHARPRADRGYKGLGTGSPAGHQYTRTLVFCHQVHRHSSGPSPRSY
jgi:hypothetical protein